MKAMLKEGWYEAHDEDAAGVWRVMIEAWEREKRDRESSVGTSSDLDSRCRLFCIAIYPSGSISALEVHLRSR